MNGYELIDCGAEEKLERFGPYTFLRPCSAAVWKKEKPFVFDAQFTRDEKWSFEKKIPKSFTVEHGGVQMKIELTDFGHLGLFPEHRFLWDWVRSFGVKGKKILNLFAYSGGASLVALQEGAQVCHLDSSKGMVEWAKENAKLNQLEHLPIRWIVDDALKFLKREHKRESFYDGIILDPPTFGRGSKGEVFKIERDIVPLLECCMQLKPSFVILSAHTPGFTPTTLKNLLMRQFKGGKIVQGELFLSNEKIDIPSGSYAIWSR